MREAAASEPVGPAATHGRGPTTRIHTDKPASAETRQALSPNRLSVAGIERRLGLPPGAWRRRHLVALRVVGKGFSEIGLRPGDHLIVEPGARTSAGSLVVVRAGEEIAIRRVVQDGAGRVLLTPADPSVLPFPAKRGRHAVMGTVLGALPATIVLAVATARPCARRREAVRRRGRDGADATSAGGRGRRSAQCGSRDRHRERGTRTDDQEVADAERFGVLLEAWRRWMEKAVLSKPSNPRAGHWRALNARLRTLTSCLEVTGPSPLRRALAQEGETVLRAMVREVRLAGHAAALTAVHRGRAAEPATKEPGSPATGAHRPPVQGDLFGGDGVDRRAARMVVAPERGAGRSLRRGQVLS